MSDELKLEPCPFCGHEGETVTNGIGDFYVTCKYCHARTSDIRCEAREYAAERWNERAELTRLRTVIAENDETISKMRREHTHLHTVYQTAAGFAGMEGDDDYFSLPSLIRKIIAERDTARAEAIASALQVERMRDALSPFILGQQDDGNALFPDCLDDVVIYENYGQQITVAHFRSALSIYYANPPPPALAQVREALEKCCVEIELLEVQYVLLSQLAKRGTNYRKESRDAALTAARAALALIGGEK